MSDMPHDMKEAILRGIAEQLNDGGEEPKQPKRPLPLQARILKDVLPDLQRPNPFKVGDLVQQQRGQRCYKWPDEDALAMVTEVYDPLPPNQRGKGNRCAREDMIIVCNVDGTWVEFAVESWRFDAYQGPVEGETVPR